MKVSPRSKLLSGTEGAGLPPPSSLHPSRVTGGAKAHFKPGGRAERRSRAEGPSGRGGLRSPLPVRLGRLAPPLGASPFFFGLRRAQGVPIDGNLGPGERSETRRPMAQALRVWPSASESPSVPPVQSSHRWARLGHDGGLFFLASGPGVVRLEHRETRAPAGPGHPRLSTGQTDRNNRKTASRPRSSLGYRERKKNFGLPGARKNFGLPGARKNFGLPGARKIFGLPGARRSSVAEGLFFCCSCPSGRCLSVGTQALLVIGCHGAPAGRLLRTAGVAQGRTTPTPDHRGGPGTHA